MAEMPTVLFACERRAAKLLDMKPAEFRALVNAGALPRPRRINEFERWDIEDLRRAIRGEGPEEKPTW